MGRGVKSRTEVEVGESGLDLVRAHQVHGAQSLSSVRVRSARHPFRQRIRPDADIIVSDDGAAALAVQAADCVPLLVADRRTGAVAAAHAGWRGLAAGVPADSPLRCRSPSRTAAQPAGGSRSAAVGPSISACCDMKWGSARAPCAAASGSPAIVAARYPSWRAGSRNPPAKLRGVARGSLAVRQVGGGARPTRVRPACRRIRSTSRRSARRRAFRAVLLMSTRRPDPPAGRMAAVVRARTTTPPPRRSSRSHSRVAQAGRRCVFDCARGPRVRT